MPEGYKIRILLKDLQNGHLEEGTEKKAPLHVSARNIIGLTNTSERLSVCYISLE